MNPEARATAVLARRLRFGDLDTRRAMAAAIASGDHGLVALLARTARADGDLILRARCLEVLGLALADARPEVMREIVALLLD